MYQRQVTFGEAISRALNNYCNFSGRASRSEFWWWQLFTFIVGSGVSLIGSLILGKTGVNIFSTIVSLAFLLPSLGLLWRRLHDIGRAGGWAFVSLIPVAGVIVLIVWCCQDSEPHPNRFGPEPNMVA